MDEPILSEFSHGFIQMLQKFLDAPEPEPAFLSGLEQQLLERHAVLLGSSHPERSFLAPLRKRYARALTRRGWQLAAVGLLVVVAIGLYVLLTRPSPVSAEEILANARTAAMLPAGGVQSFALSETRRAVPANPRMNAQSGLKGDEQILNETKRWYEAPNRWRVEFQQRILAPDGKEISHFSAVEVSDGTTLWYYVPEQNSVIVNRYDPAIDGKGDVALFGQNVGALNDLLQQAATCYEPKVTGNATIAGRPTYVIDLGPTKCPSASATEMNGRLILWVDKENFFILKQEQYGPDGSQLIMTSEVTDIEYNIPLDAGLFTFTPPAGVAINDNRPKPAPSSEDFQKQLEQLARQVDFPIFAPDYLPEGLKPRQPRRNPPEGNSVELAYVPPDEVEKDTLAEGNGILIQQQKATNSLVSRWTEGADPITIPEGRSWLRRGKLNPDGTGSNSAALVLRDGVLISISSFRITPEELVKIAASLKPAPGSHAPLPNPIPPTLSEIRERASFPVFVPTYLPEGLALASVTGGELPAENVTIRYLHPNGTVGLIVINGNPDCCPGLLPMPSEELNLPNGISAHLIRTPTTIYGGMTLWWEQEGAHLEVIGPNLLEEELLKIAASMSRTADLGELKEGTPQPAPTRTAELPFEVLLPTWLPEEAERSIQVDGEIITIGFDPRPGDAPHSLLTLVEMPSILITPGGAPDPQATQEQMGEYEVTVIRRGQDCITLEWVVGDLHLQLTNPYDPPGQPRYSCDQLRKVVESIHK